MEALVAGSTVLLQAAPGAGKTTRVPLALLQALQPGERILLLEPRRLAARGAAERLAQGLAEPPRRWLDRGTRWGPAAARAPQPPLPATLSARSRSRAAIASRRWAAPSSRLLNT